MEEKMLNAIKNKINSFNEKHGLRLGIIETNLEENKNMFGVSGDMSNFSQAQSNELETLLIEFGYYYTNCRGEVENSTKNNRSDIWTFALK